MNETQIIIATVARMHSIDPADFLNDEHTRCRSWPRQIAMSLARKHTRRSLPQLGLDFRKHHTTIMWGDRNARARIEFDNEQREIFEACDAAVSEALSAHRAKLRGAFDPIIRESEEHRGLGL